MPERIDDLDHPEMKDFLELLKENLILKHGVPKLEAATLAKTW
jgi:hypothetical protein